MKLPENIYEPIQTDLDIEELKLITDFMDHLISNSIEFPEDKKVE